MYLKEIKLSGFKSFADKLNIEFNDGITCVVGPNGSGKSNVVDAVRWVLGEQSVKSLRGEGGMSDVIFSGSKSRNSHNVASVTLIFDNSDKHLPIDYAEVSIKRRVYNNGENEYFLNGEQCRLKDIVDLFVDSGISKESFNIISQGEIQKIIGTKPEERRQIFEEAAEVLKYKRRKEESIRKIARTHDNLNRVNDIINELEQQIDPLKEQSEKAKEYLAAKQELDEVEIALITHDIETYNHEYQDAKKNIEILNEEILQSGTEFSNEQANVERQRVDLQKLDQKIYETQQNLVAVSSQAEKLSGQKQMVTERQKYSASDQRLHENIINLKENELKIQNDIVGIENDIKVELGKANKIEEAIQHLMIDLKNEHQMKSQVTMQLDNTVRRERELNHRVELLRESIEHYGGLASGTRNVITNPKLNGVHGIIGKLIEVKDDYIVAIETSLGASMQFIVVDNEKCAKEAINYLKVNNMGRATFFPLNIIQPKGVDEQTLEKISNHPSFVDVAAHLTNYDSKFRSIILNQLGNVIITTDLDGANDISNIINHRYKIVTLDGELIHVGGSITGGNDKRHNGMIKEKYELESMLREIVVINAEQVKLEQKVLDFNNDVKDLEMKIFKLKGDRASLLEIISSKHNILNSYKKKHDSVQSEWQGLNNVVNNTLSNEEESIINAYFKALGEKETLEKEIEEMNKKRHDLYNSIEEVDHVLRKNNQYHQKKQTELQNLEIKVNRLDVKLDALLNSLNEEYSMTYDKAKENYKLEIKVDDARIKVNSAKAKIKNLGMVNIAAIDEFERVNKRYMFLSNQKDDLLKAENILLDIIKEMDTIMEQTFAQTFNLIKIEFAKVFKQLFGGGEAELKLTDPTNMLETGIEIIASPPGKKLQHLSLLSGGEKTLTAIALLFAILNIKAVPFCLFDEIEAALDEVNVSTFGEYLKTYKHKTQFIIITHKKKTMEYADILYGITMQESGVSKLVSVKLENVKEYAHV